MEESGCPKSDRAINQEEEGEGNWIPNEETYTRLLAEVVGPATSERQRRNSQSSYSGSNNSYDYRDYGLSYFRLEHPVRHMQTHTRFVCSICQKSFVRKDLLHLHVASHQIDSPKTPRRTTTSPDARRISRACRPCAIAKVVCNKAKPCERCVNADINCIPTEPPLTVAARSVNLAGKSLSATPNAIGDHDPGLEGEKSLAREHTIFEDSGYGSIVHGTIQDPGRTVSGANSALDSVPLQPQPDQLVDGDGMPNMSECNDLSTCYSDATAISAQRIEDHALEFAEELFKVILDCDVDQSRLQSSFSTISKLLKDFSTQIGREGTPQVYRDVMFFTHKYRGHICKWLYHLSSKSDRSELRHNNFTSEQMPLRECLGIWFEGLPGDTSEYQHFHDLRIAEDINSSDVSSISEPSWLDETKGTSKEAYTGVFREFVLNSSACRWLLPRLKLELCCVHGQSQAMDKIKSAIKSRLKLGRKISKRICEPSQSVLFIIEWDLEGFLQEQELGISSHEAIAKIITLTGDNDLIQALTTEEFMKQTWPMTGPQVLGVVQDAYKTGRKSNVTLYDGTELIALFRDDLLGDQELMVSAKGSSPSLSEVGEQLAWLAAALRSAPSRDWKQCVYCTPFVCHEEIPSNPVICKIGFDFQNIDKRYYPANGHCWHNLFISPVVVGGYPIPSRPEAYKGIEIPLNIMVLLAGTNQINTFNGKTFIKGFSTLIYPTEKTAGTIYWHLTETNNKDRISYLSETPGHAGFIEKRELEGYRCVLGWCSDAEFYAGSAYADYLIESAHLGTPDPGCPLADLTLIPSIPVADCSAFVICKRDCDLSRQLGRKGYIKKLKWLDKKFVLLWDEGDRRGWLMKGVTALLHLVRSSLEYDSVDKFSSEFLFRKEDLEEAESVDPQAAVKVLLSKKNKTLKLYDEEDESFKDRVEHCFGILERLIDYQEDAGERASRYSKEQARQYLSGWDFHDLATKSDTRLFSRMTILESPGKSWVDFIKSIQAITLFGRGFGMLIKPSGSTAICNNWRDVPKNRFYISAAISDLKDITNVSSTNNRHNQIGLNHIWHTETTAFEYTPCPPLRGNDCHEPVQSLLPLSMSAAVPRSREPMLPESGAVIFGHHSKLGWVWEDFGPPRRGELRPYVSTLVDLPLPTDSGYVSSHKSSIQEFHFKSSLSQSNGAMSTAVAESPTPAEQYPRELYTVGILCALDIELLAIRVLFDETHHDTDRALGDDCAYALGRMGKHKVVVTCLPDGEYGTNPAAECATNMKRSFPNIKFCLVVGIGGGVPSDANDIRLGDVVVSLPKDDLSGVIQYDRGKDNDDVTFKRTGALQGPPRAICSLINFLKSTPRGSSDQLLTYIQQIIESESVSGKRRFSHPGEELDILFESYCDEGNTSPHRPRQVKRREPRSTNSPVVHYGIIASGNKVIKNPKFRDEWGQKYGVLCFEMEAAGVMNILPTLVIRGICDYCDAQKNNIWQEYASATAAAYSRHLLVNLPCHEPDNKILWRRTNSDLCDTETEGRPKKFLKTA